MGHGFEEKDTMFSVKERPWHGLGTVVQDAPSVSEAIKLAGLDWTVSLRPLCTEEENSVSVTTHSAVVRDDDNSVLGVVGSTYKPLQNLESFEFFQPFVEDGLASLETAGSLFNGKKTFILATTNAEADVVKDDTVQSFILLSNAHDGSQAVRVGFTPIRVVCNNTLTAAIRSDMSKLIRVRHSASVKENLELIRNTMDTVNSQFLATIEQYKELAKRDVVQSDLEKYVKQVFSLKKLEDIIHNYEQQEEKKFRNNLMERINYYFEEEPQHKVWNMYNAVNSYLNHDRSRSLESTYNSLWFGYNKVFDKRALELAIKSY